MKRTVTSLLLLSYATNSHAHLAEGTSQVSEPQEFWLDRHNGRNLATEDKFPCVVDEDCTDHPFFLCGIKETGFCGHKDVLPVEPLEIAGIFVFSFIMALSNVAGVGGGGVAIPVLMAFFLFKTKPAIAVSSFSIFVTTLARFIMNFRERHPEKNNVVVIDYDLVTIMMPTTLAGAQIGAIILVVFPSIIIQAILTVMLVFLLIQSVIKARSLTKEENEARDRAKVAAITDANTKDSGRTAIVTQELAVLAADDRKNGVRPTPIEGRTDTEANQDAAVDMAPSPTRVDHPRKLSDLSKVAEPVDKDDPNYDTQMNMIIDQKMMTTSLKGLKASVKAESSHGQWLKQGLCIILLCCLILMNLCLGTSSFESIVGLEKCGAGAYIVQLIFILICVCFTYVAVRIAQRDQKRKIKYGGINLSESDIRYTDKKRLCQLLFLGFVGGWVAGALGLGGGSIYNPALLYMGIPPKVSSATGLYLVTFSKIAAVLIYFLNDQLDLYYGMWIGFWSCLGMVAGLLMTNYYMKKSGRQSIIVWALVIIFVSSVIAIPIFGGLSLSKEVDEGLDLWAFSDVCKK